jgi:hypothetical protein
MINRDTLVWSAMTVRKEYKKLKEINYELTLLFGENFPFVKPGHQHYWKEFDRKDLRKRNQILSIPYLPYDLIKAEQTFKMVYSRHLGIINFFKK